MTMPARGVRGPLPTADPTVAERWTESRGPLVERLRDRIVAEGPMTFATFMASALYDPLDGYYATATDRAAREGDFLTAPEMDPIFGAALAGHLEDGWARLGRPAPFTWREEGAGSGALAVAVLGELRRHASPLLEALRYVPTEATSTRATALRQRLAAEGFERWLTPHLDAEPRPHGRLTGVITANELLDALPVHRVAMRGGQLVELFVDWRDDWFADAAGPPSGAGLAAMVAASGLDLREGDRAEVSPAATAWVKQAAASLGRGWLLLIDYGGEGHQLWGAAHPEGLLRTYRGHHVGADPYRAIGRQDLTAHVDLTAIRRAGADAGLDLLGATTQAEFLAGLGAGELLVQLGEDPATTAQRYHTARGALLRLLDPSAMGRFAVLAMGRGLLAQPPLRGFDYHLPAR
ncbi:MAG: class I SAM-dependent methyltransferase [Candidatus Limnocylindrales bacterium]